MTDNEGYVLALQEVQLHPNSYLIKLEEAFEKPSVIHVHTKDALRRINEAPVYNDRYLVIFESSRIFESNINYIRLKTMLPVVLCQSKGQSEDVRFICQEKNVPCKVFVNQFTKSDATDLIIELTHGEASKKFCDDMISRVGLSPQRIISGVLVCEQVGFTSSNISKYVDKYNYIDIYDVIESLLGICKSQAQRRRAALYLHQNRVWYSKYTKQNLLREMDTLLGLYHDITDGSLTEYTLHTYIDEKHVSRYRALYAFDLYERVSYTQLLALRQFVDTASLLEVSMSLH